MLEEMINFLKTIDIEKISLSVSKDNIPAINLYKKIGFSIEQEIYEEHFKQTIIYMVYKY